MSIGDNIKKYRKQSKLRLTQADLGEKIGKKAITVRHYENGNINPPKKVLEDIARVLGISLEELIGDNGSEISLPPVTTDSVKLIEKAMGVTNIEYSQEEKEALTLTDAIDILLKRNGYNISSFSASEVDKIIKLIEDLVVAVANIKEIK